MDVPAKERTMNARMLALLSLAALTLAGCETLNGPQAYANADDWKYGCKTTVVTNTPEQMRMQNEKGVTTDETKRTEGVLALGKIKQNEPQALLQGRAAGETSLTSQTLRGC
jgi:hypothetical protein